MDCQRKYTFDPMDPLNRMPREGTVYLKGLPWESSHVGHGSNMRRTQDVDSGCLLDWTGRVFSRTRIKTTIFDFGCRDVDVWIDCVNICNVVSNSNMPGFCETGTVQCPCYLRQRTSNCDTGYTLSQERKHEIRRCLCHACLVWKKIENKSCCIPFEGYSWSRFQDLFFKAWQELRLTLCQTRDQERKQDKRKGSC